MNKKAFVTSNAWIVTKRVEQFEFRTFQNASKSPYLTRQAQNSIPNAPTAPYLALNIGASDSPTCVFDSSDYTFETTSPPRIGTKQKSKFFARWNPEGILKHPLIKLLGKPFEYRLPFTCYLLPLARQGVKANQASFNNEFPARLDLLICLAQKAFYTIESRLFHDKTYGEAITLSQKATNRSTVASSPLM